jgi:hypothetical protein
LKNLQSKQETTVQELSEMEKKINARPVSKPQTGLTKPVEVVIDKKPSVQYGFVGVVDGTLFVRDGKDIISSYEIGETIPGYGRINSISSSGEVETSGGMLRYTL